MALDHVPRGDTSVVRPTLLYINKMLKEGFTCHPERSEGSHAFEKARFFASLRMTIKVKRFMTHHTSLEYRGASLSRLALLEGFKVQSSRFNMDETALFFEL
jgi:hypothetical protein